MRAAVFHKGGMPLTIEQVADPTPKADQVIIEVARSGICGSDLHIADYGIAPAGTILGHEFAGTIVEVGSAVPDGWRPGDRVTALPIHSCERCDVCADGLPGLCSSAVFAGTSPLLQGAYAQYVPARGTMLQRLPAGVPFDEGAMVEPLAVAHHAVELAENITGAVVLVIGAGPIGAGVTLFSRLAGARHVIVSEHSIDRRQRALEVGATAVIDPSSENIAERIAALTGRAPQVVFECVGSTGLIQHALELTATRGRVIVAGACFQDDMIKPLSGVMKEITIRFSQCYTERDFEQVIDAITTGRANPRPLHTSTIGFDALPEKFASLRNASSDCKVLIDPTIAYL